MHTHKEYCKKLELFKEYSINPTIKQRNRIIEEHKGFVFKIAQNINNRCPEPYEDLLQIGYLGLIIAVERFDISKGNAFTSFAMPYVRGEIQHYLRDKSSTIRISRGWYDLHRRSVRANRDLTEKLGRIPSDIETAEALDVTIDKWCECKMIHYHSRLASLDTIIVENDRSCTTIIDSIADNRTDLNTLSDGYRLQLYEELNKLEDKTKLIIQYVFLLDWKKKDVAELLGVSTGTITRRLHKGLQQLRTAFS